MSSSPPWLVPPVRPGFFCGRFGLGRLTAAASVPLMLEYEAGLKRPETLERAGGTPAAMDIILDQLAATMQQVPIWYLWRSQLRDRDDDMVLEAAANAAGTHLVSFNIHDFGEAPGKFGIQLCRPSELARRLRNG